jgi:hypothetical protein
VMEYRSIASAMSGTHHSTTPILHHSSFAFCLLFL